MAVEGVRISVTITAPNSEAHLQAQQEVREALTAAGYDWRRSTRPGSEPPKPSLRVIQGGGGQQ